MTELPLHIRIMASLGIVKITQKKLPEEYHHYQTRKGIKWPGMRKILPVGILLPVILSLIHFYPLLGHSNPEADLKADIERVAHSEGKLDWQTEKWDNPNTLIKLNEVKIEIDNSSCDQLVKLFKDNKGWTLRAYTAQTILEKGCK